MAPAKNRHRYIGALYLKAKLWNFVRTLLSGPNLILETGLRLFQSLFVVIIAALAAHLPATARDDGKSGFQTVAPHAIIMDYETGLVLFEKNARVAIAPASMTKVMTADMVFERIRDGSLSLDTEFTVSENAWRQGGAKSGSSTMFLDPESTVRVEDLLRGVIIQSGNDACIVLAEGIAGSEAAFARMMTDRARQMGLSSAVFRNSTGWPHPEHRVNLYDLALLAKHTIGEYPEFYPLYAEESFTWNGILQANRNPLLGRFSGADGLKTGYTKVSGYGLAASAGRDGTRRIVVINGLESTTQRRSESLRLMQAAFDRFIVQDIYGAGQFVSSLPVFMGKSDQVGLVTDAQVRIGMRREDSRSVTLRVKADGPVAAPVARGDHVADLVIDIPGRPTETFKLLAAEDVDRKSAFGRAMTALVDIIRG